TKKSMRADARVAVCVSRTFAADAFRLDEIHLESHDRSTGPDGEDRLSRTRTLIRKRHVAIGIDRRKPVHRVGRATDLVRGEAHRCTRREATRNAICRPPRLSREASG